MARSDHVIDEIPAYALGAVDAVERKAIESHLKSCPQCKAELYSYHETIAKLALTAPQILPSPQLKQRILARTKIRAIRPKGGKSFIQWFQAAPALSLIGLAVIVILLVSNVLLWRQVSDLGKMQQHGYAAVTLNGTTASPAASGLVVYTMDGMSGFLVVNHLAPLANEKQYQLWLIKGTQRSNGGVFSVSAEGYHVMEINSAELLTGYDGFGITIEPTGGSPAPTGTKVMGGSF
jgi:anti-sigma-K factor RskA